MVNHNRWLSKFGESPCLNPFLAMTKGMSSSQLLGHHILDPNEDWKTSLECKSNWSNKSTTHNESKWRSIVKFRITDFVGHRL